VLAELRANDDQGNHNGNEDYECQQVGSPPLLLIMLPENTPVLCKQFYVFWGGLRMQ